MVDFTLCDGREGCVLLRHLQVLRVTVSFLHFAQSKDQLWCKGGRTYVRRGQVVEVISAPGVGVIAVVQSIAPGSLGVVLHLIILLQGIAQPAPIQPRR